MQFMQRSKPLRQQFKQWLRLHTLQVIGALGAEQAKQKACLSFHRRKRARELLWFLTLKGALCLLFVLVCERFPLGIVFDTYHYGNMWQDRWPGFVHKEQWLHNDCNVPQGDQVFGSACMLWECKSAVCSYLLNHSVPQGDQGSAGAKVFYSSLIIQMKVARAEK